MSDTPRTDAAVDSAPEYATHGYVHAGFAAELERELMEQCRLNGMGSEREASMLAQIERLQRENARLQMELDGTCNAEELRQVREENAKLKQAAYEAMHAMDELAALREDKARLDWLATQCYLPGEHPDDGVLVVISEKFAPYGSFTCKPDNDQKAIRAAIDAAMEATS